MYNIAFDRNLYLLGKNYKKLINAYDTGNFNNIRRYCNYYQFSNDSLLRRISKQMASPMFQRMRFFA